MLSPVRELRDKLGLSQREFAMLCGLAASTVSNIESGYHPLTKSAIDSLNEIGLDGEQISQAQKQYVEQCRQELIKRFKSIDLNKT